MRMKGSNNFSSIKKDDEQEDDENEDDEEYLDSTVGLN
jgi:hypothetical protein